MTESEYMPEVRRVWAMRAAELKLKPGTKGYEAQQEAYLQGVVAVATATGVMTMARAHMVSFLVACGRINMMFEEPK